MTLASQPVAFFASSTVSNTGSPRCVCPPLPGAVPPTILVPYSIAACEWKVPFLPVKPWQMTLVFLSMRMDIEFLLNSVAHESAGARKYRGMLREYQHRLVVESGKQAQVTRDN